MICNFNLFVSSLYAQYSSAGFLLYATLAERNRLATFPRLLKLISKAIP
jgi:hypothetical protein